MVEYYVSEVIKWIGILILGFIIFCLFTVFCVYPLSNNCYVGNKIIEYEDMNGNIGIASNCQFSDADDYYRKGGQGQPICFIGKRVIVVKWYEDKTNYKNCFTAFKEELKEELKEGK